MKNRTIRDTIRLLEELTDGPKRKRLQLDWSTDINLQLGRGGRFTQKTGKALIDLRGFVGLIEIT